VFAVSDSELARELDCSVQSVQKKRTGATRISLSDIERMAVVLGVPEYVLQMDGGQLLGWLAEHRLQELRQPKPRRHAAALRSR
jgi:hypothetical protein